MSAAAHAAPIRASLAHRPYEDAQGLLAGTLFVALGALMFAHAKLLTGGTAGVALLICYATGWSFGPVFFAVNLPSTCSRGKPWASPSRCAPWRP